MVIQIVSGQPCASFSLQMLRGGPLTPPSVKYVALLAFNHIVRTHPFLVAEQEDVILDCIDSPDITIRIKALDLVRGMVSSDNLVSIVGRLMRQLKMASASSAQADEPADCVDDDDDMEVKIKAPPKGEHRPPPLPEDYRVDVIGRILSMCSQDNYRNMVDFEWYIDVLTQLVRVAPTQRVPEDDGSSSQGSDTRAVADISERIGDELRNVAVKVRAVRQSAVRAAELIVQQLSLETPAAHPIVSKALKPLSWMLGEYASELSSTVDTLGCLLQLIPRTTSPDVLSVCLQAVVKLFAAVALDRRGDWSPERKSSILLLLARVIHTIEPLNVHPSLEVQERAVEFTELLKLLNEAANAQQASTNEFQQDAPLLLTQALPSLFAGWELKSVAPDAQMRVPLPEGLDLDEPIHGNLAALLAEADNINIEGGDGDDFEIFYYQRPPQPTVPAVNEPAINKIGDASSEVPSSYQEATDESYLDADIIARRRAERQERYRDDPFYIQPTPAGGSSSAATPRSNTPIGNILKTANGPDLDIDSIPIMELDLNNINSAIAGSSSGASTTGAKKASAGPRPRPAIVVAADETLGGGPGSGPRSSSGVSSPNQPSDTTATTASRKPKHAGGFLLGVDSSHLTSLTSLEDGGRTEAEDAERRRAEEAEMARAMREVERLRLEMQRANERVRVAQGVSLEGEAVVSLKKTKKKKTAGEGGSSVKTKKKAKASAEDAGQDDGTSAVIAVPAAEHGMPEDVSTGPQTTTVAVKKKKKKAAVPDAAVPEVAVAKPKKKKKVARAAEIEELAPE